MSDRSQGVALLVGLLAVGAFLLWRLLASANRRRELPMPRGRLLALLGILIGAMIGGGLLGIRMASVDGD